jgi:4-aminobutyrate aminotransferase-like enzyme
MEFKLKHFRPSGASTFGNNDPELMAAISTQLRHKNMATTQKYYARIESGTAAKQPPEALLPQNDAQAQKIEPSEQISQAIMSKKAVIDSKFEMTGYV